MGGAGVVLSALAPTLIARATQHQTGDYLPRSYDSAAALHIAEEQFGVNPDATTVTVLVGRSDGRALSAADQKRAAAEAAKLGQRRVIMTREEDGPHFLVPDRSQTPRIAPAMTAPDRSFELLSVQLTGNPSDKGAQGVHRAFRDAARTQFSELGMRTGFTGGLADTVDTTDAHETAAKVGGALVMGFIVLLDVVVFRSALAALLPLLAVAMIGGVAMGTVAGAAMLAGRKLDASTPNLINVVLLGIGIDYLLFLLFRFREQLRNRHEQSAGEAAEQVSGRVGTAITSAALTVVAAFATLGLATFGGSRRVASCRVGMVDSRAPRGRGPSTVWNRSRLLSVTSCVPCAWTEATVLLTETVGLGCRRASTGAAEPFEGELDGRPKQVRGPKRGARCLDDRVGRVRPGGARRT